MHVEDKLALRIASNSHRGCELMISNECRRLNKAIKDRNWNRSDGPRISGWVDSRVQCRSGAGTRRSLGRVQEAASSNESKTVQTYSMIAGLVSGPQVGQFRQAGRRSKPTLPLPRSLVLPLGALDVATSSGLPPSLRAGLFFARGLPAGSRLGHERCAELLCIRIEGWQPARADKRTPRSAGLQLR